MKAKRYKITVYDGMLAITHGMGSTIDEISVGDVFINYDGIHQNYEGRDKDVSDVKEIEFDDGLYKSIKDFMSAKKTIDKELMKLFYEETPKAVPRDRKKRHKT